MITPQLFTLHWTWIGWVIAFILMIFLFTNAWHYVLRLSLTFLGIGWLCTLYAIYTGDWFSGWFAWTIFLSTAIFIRLIVEYIINLPEKKEGIKEVVRWVTTESYKYTHRTIFWTSRWQAQLKEWGIEVLEKEVE